MKYALKSIKRGIRALFHRDNREDEYRLLALEHAKIQKFHDDSPHCGVTAVDDVVTIASIRTAGLQATDTVLGREEDLLLARLLVEVVESVKAGDTVIREPQATRVSDNALQSQTGTFPVAKRCVTMPEKSRTRPCRKVEQNMPLGEEDNFPVRRLSLPIGRIPVDPDQRYPSFVRF